MNDRYPVTEISEIKFFSILFGALLFIFATSFLFGTKVERSEISVPTNTVVAPFPQVNIGAKAAYVYDVRTKKVLFAKNENARLPLASLTKVMTALVASETQPLFSSITISDEALKADGDSGLVRGEKWSLKNLLDYSLITSSNDGMRAVALSFGALSRSDATSTEIIKDFVSEMNIKAQDIGLKNTFFWNETGLDESDSRGGAYGTAKDMSDLLEYILFNRPDLFSMTKESLTTIYSDENIHIARNTNIIASEIPGLVASKTGFTNTAGGNLVVIFDPELGRPIIVSILGSTERGRFDDVRTLVKATIEYIGDNPQSVANN